MGSGMLTLASLASLLPLLACQWWTLGSANTPQLCFALALLPWMLLVGLPRGGSSVDSEPSAVASGLRVVSLASPILVLAVMVDSDRESASNAIAEGWPAWSFALLLLLALHTSASRAAHHSRWHGLSFLVLVGLAPLLGALIEQLDSSAEAASWAISSRTLFDASPLALLLRMAAGSPAALSTSAIACSSATLAVLLVTAELDRRRPERSA